jgi:hypothetical protein
LDADNAAASETLALSARPYLALTRDLTDRNTQRSLEQLLATVDAMIRLDDGLAPTGADARADLKPPLPRSLPRSQLKSLVAELGQGRRWGQLAYDEVRARLDASFLTLLDQGPGAAAEHGLTPDGRAWLQPDVGAPHYVTHLGDLIELLELRYLGRRKQDQAQGATPDHDRGGETDG